MAILKKINQYSNEGVSIQVTSKSPVVMVEVAGIPKEHRQKGWKDGMVLVGLSKDTDFGFVFMTHKHPCAIVPSIRGVNPISGLKAVGQIVRYGRGTVCPADASHGLLKKDGLCTSCKHNWPVSNYVSVRNTNFLKGWRVGKNELRSFVTLSDVGKDVAESMIPGEAVPSVGFIVYSTPASAPFGGYLTSSSISQNALLQHSTGYPNQNISWTSCTTNSPSYSSEVVQGVQGCQGVQGIQGPPGIGVSCYHVQDVAIGAGEAVEAQDDTTTSIDPETLEEKPLFSVIMKFVGITELEALIKVINGNITSGPFKGMPVA
jgi:hypothetical protein